MSEKMKMAVGIVWIVGAGAAVVVGVSGLWGGYAALLAAGMYSLGLLIAVAAS